MRARVKYLFLALSGFILLAALYRKQIVTIGPRGGGGGGGVFVIASQSARRLLTVFWSLCGVFSGLRGQ